MEEAVNKVNCTYESLLYTLTNLKVLVLAHTWNESYDIKAITPPHIV